MRFQRKKKDFECKPEEEFPFMRQKLKAERDATHAEKQRQTLSLASASGLIGKETITIPDWVKYIDFEVLYAFERIRDFSVAPGNPVYKSIDGVLYAERQFDTKKICTLERYPPAREGGEYRVPEGVHLIGDDAFINCAKLTTVHIPTTTHHIFTDTFCGSGVRHISADPENRDFTDIDGVLYSKYKTDLRIYPPERDSDSYTIPKGVRMIWFSAFQNARKLVSINIPDSVDFIGNYAFEGCISLKEITLTQARFNDNCRMFYNCPSLENIYVSRNNGELLRPGHFQSIEGVLFNGPMTHSRFSTDGGRREWVEFTLVRYPEGKTQPSYTVPEGVSEILTYAFSGQSHLRSVTFPESVLYIGECAFEGCSEDLTLHCAENSCAHKYAKSENMKFEIVR